MSSKDYLISLLTLDDQEIISYALEEICKSVQADWFWFIPHVQAIDSIKEQFPNFSNEVNLLLSQLHFYGNDMDQSVKYALDAGDLFNPNKRDLYTDNILTLMMTQYIQVQQGRLQISEDSLGQYQRIAEKVLNTSFASRGKGDNAMLLGLAIETKNFEFFKLLIIEMGDWELDRIFNFVSRRVYDPELKRRILKLFLAEFQKRKGMFSYNISQSLFLLGNFNEHADYIIELVLSKFNSGNVLSKQQSSLYNLLQIHILQVYITISL